MKSRIVLSLPIIMASVAIVIASGTPSIHIPEIGIWQTDKLLHIAAYFIYGCLIQLFIFGNFKLSKAKTIIYTIAFGLLFAMSDEIHQSFVPGRVCDIYDFIADAIGIFLSLLLFTQISKISSLIKRKFHYS